MKKIAETVMDEVSYSKLHNILKSIGVNISKDAVIDYVKYAREAFLIFAIRNYFSKFTDKETTPKYYFNDNGLLNLFLNKEEPRLLENLVAVNLWNKYKDNLYYLKSQNIDADFFVEETGEVVRTIKESKRFIIITYEEEKEMTVDGGKIEVFPIWKWLIEN